MTCPETTPALAARQWRSLRRALSINPEDFPYMRLRRALAACVDDPASAGALAA